MFQAGLTDASTAKLVRLENGVPVATDGPFAESPTPDGGVAPSRSRAARSVKTRSGTEDKKPGGSSAAASCSRRWRALSLRQGGLRKKGARDISAIRTGTAGRFRKSGHAPVEPAAPAHLQDQLTAAVHLPLQENCAEVG